MALTRLLITAAFFLTLVWPLNARPSARSADVQPAPPTIPVKVFWSAPGNMPLGVRFDRDPSNGAFRRASATSVLGSPEMTHLSRKLIIRYGDGEVPLMLRLIPGDEIELPAFRATDECSPGAVAAVRQASAKASSVESRIIIMLRWRHIVVSGTQCGYMVRKSASDNYFALNCELAKEISYLDLSREAQDAYLEHAASSGATLNRNTAAINQAKNQARKEINACIDKIHANTIYYINAHRKFLQNKSRNTTFVVGLLRTLANDPSWSRLFSAAGVNLSEIMKQSK